jgi:glycosyltransferase involved in cell wall biosynthesis
LKSKINVLQLVEGFGLGGAEKKVWELIAQMDRSRFRTVVCSFGISEGIRDYFTGLGVKVITLNRRHRFDLSLIFKLRRVIRQERIDIVMTTLFYADMMGALVGKWAGAKGVFSWETISSPEWLIPRRLYPYRAVIRLADKVISVSRATARWLVEKRGVSPEHIVVIPYGVDLSLFKNGEDKELRRELGLSDHQPVVGMVGRLVPQKGHRYLIDAAVKVIESVPDVRFVLAGDGPLRPELEQQVCDRGLQDHFFFLGLRHDIPRVLRSFDIFTLPSMFEGLPNVVLEAMATSKPIVATPVDGTKEAVKHGTSGLLVPPRNIDKLASALIELLKNPKRAREMGRNARERVEKEFSLELQVKSFEDLFERWAFRTR